VRKLVSIALLLGGCGVVRQSAVRADYATADRTQTVRLAIVIDALPANRRDVGVLWAKMAQRYTNHHRDFIAKRVIVASATTAPCADDIEGVLAIHPEARLAGDGAEVDAEARLYRCRDQETVWTASGGGSFPSQDPTVSELIKQYKEEVGPEVEPYVAPSFHVIRALLDTLPEPKLPSDDAVMEKIELAD
jgi:probable lipoprotein (TIGR04455 family)